MDRRQSRTTCSRRSISPAGNDKPVDKTDYFKIVSMATPEEVRDPNEARDCKLQAYDATPSYEL